MFPSEAEILCITSGHIAYSSVNANFIPWKLLLTKVIKPPFRA